MVGFPRYTWPEPAVQAEVNPVFPPHLHARAGATYWSLEPPEPIRDTPGARTRIRGRSEEGERMGIASCVS